MGTTSRFSELLKMRSGLYNYTSAPELAEGLDHDPTKAWTPEELLAIAFKRPPLFAPGTEYDYCNNSYVLLGSSWKTLRARRWQKFFRTVCLDRLA